MTVPADEWPMPAYKAPDKDHLHALGVISINYNSFEHVLFGVFRTHLHNRQIPQKFSSFIFGELNRQSQVEAIRELYLMCERDPKVINSIELLLSHFSWCSQTRDLLLHAHEDTISKTTGKLALSKRSREEYAKLNFMELSLPHLRAIADSMHEGYVFALDLFTFLEHRSGRSPPWIPIELLSLPEKLQIPRPIKVRGVPADGAK